MNPNMKVLFIVCDNVRRTLSRYLHMQVVQKKENCYKIYKSYQIGIF